jgi:alkaline phosphatase
MKTNAILVALLLAPATALGAGEAKNVIFFLGDGMGPTTVTAARIYRTGEGGKLYMERLERTALVKTYSNDAQTTDSAPSMAAYMTGVKANNEVISMTADTVAEIVDGHCEAGNGQPVTTLLELAKAKGKAVGAITTTEATHATPAATYAHICHRDLAYDIARQAVPGGEGYNAALGTGLNVLMGGGWNHWTPYNSETNTKGRPDGRDLLTELSGQGFTVVTDRAGFDSIPAEATRVFGLFSSTGHLSYELDRDPTKQPSLAEMTVKAIELLKRSSPEGFFLMVEGGRIDHALHAANAKRVMGDTVAFDDAIHAAMQHVSMAETLIVVTADHDHTMVMNGYPKRGNDVTDIVYDYSTKLPALDADGNTYPVLAFGDGPNRESGVRSSVTSAQATALDYKQPSAVRLSSETHGGGDIFLMGSGPGAEKIKGVVDNTAVFGIVKEAAGL